MSARLLELADKYRAAWLWLRRCQATMGEYQRKLDEANEAGAGSMVFSGDSLARAEAQDRLMEAARVFDLACAEARRSRDALLDYLTGYEYGRGR